MKRLFVGGTLLLFVSGCLTLEDGDKLRADIASVRDTATKAQARADSLESQNKRLKAVLEQSTQVVTRNSADVGGRVDNYRAASDTKIEQLTNTLTTAKTPPIPENADAVMQEADKRLAEKQYVDARRLYEAFVNRYPKDSRAPKAQFDIGEAYYAENRYANAIGAYTKVIDNWPKSNVVPDAMYKNGISFFALKYCSDARVYFQELIKRYPHTSFKKEAQEQLHKLSKSMKNKSMCAS
jgi:tol-pal system protein YbgF